MISVPEIVVNCTHGEFFKLLLWEPSNCKLQANLYDTLLLHTIIRDNHYMKYYRWLPILILILSANAHALQSKIEILEQFDNLKMVALIDRKDIDSNPEWDPNVSEPPLTLVQAIQAVKDFNNTSEPIGAIREIEIRPIPKHDKNWHYLIKIENNAMNTKYNIYIVLMSGKVIPAMIEPQSYK